MDPEAYGVSPAHHFVSSYPQRIVSKLPLSNWISLLVGWELIFLGDYLLARQTPESHEFLFGFSVLFFSSICISTIYCARVLTQFYPHLPLFVDLPVTELHTWYTRKLKQCYEGVLPLLAGFIFAVAALLSMRQYISELSGGNETLIIYRNVWFLIGFTFTGIALWALIGVVTIPFEIARFKIKVNIYQFSGNGLQALGSTYFKMSLSIIVTYVLILGVAMLSPYRTDAIIIGWMAFGVLMILAFFLVPQISIHNIMAREKTIRLGSFSKHFELAMENSLRDPSSENMNRLKELFELQQHLNNMHEWPFDIQTLWQLLTALLIPVVLALLEIFF